jgi:D-lyxose ketol-isomerase
MVSPLTQVSIDERRTLSEFGIGGIWKVCKILEVHKNDPIGKHYHKKKTEAFALIKGSGQFLRGETETRGGLHHASWGPIKAPWSTVVNPNTYHSFELEPGSILICLASDEHDPTDDYALDAEKEYN